MAVASEEIIRDIMFTYVLHGEKSFNQIIYTSTLSSVASRPLAVQCDCVQRTFLIASFVLQKMVTAVMEECEFISKIL